MVRLRQWTSGRTPLFAWMTIGVLSVGLGIGLNGVRPSSARTITEANVSDLSSYSGICGASAGAAIDDVRFIVADDEGNRLRVYRRHGGGAALKVFDISTELQLDRRAPETDIEGAAKIGDRIYWITSHSRNHQGREHSNRCRFFATRISSSNEMVSLKFEGRPYKNLLNDLVASPQLARFDLSRAASLPPKAPGALNIEGLCAGPDHQLLIGFRNPIPGGKALLVPLLNADALLTGERAVFGEPFELDLGGLGIRDICYCEGKYLIVAGPFDGAGRSKLFSWLGAKSEPKHLKDVDLKGLNPEALIFYPDRGLSEIQLLSDDSNKQEGRMNCNDLPLSDRQFRSVTIQFEKKNKKKR